MRSIASLRNSETQWEIRKQRQRIKSNVEGATDISSCWKRRAQNSTIPATQSGRPGDATMTPCVSIEINPIPLLMIRYYCSHFRGVFRRTVVQSAPSLLAFNWLQMTVWLAFSLTRTFPGIIVAFRKIDRVSSCLCFHLPSFMIKHCCDEKILLHSTTYTRI